jgi:sulfatase maturation enzyme AslB (radical SAM superfamily)
MCPRNYRGYDYNSGYPVTQLSLAQFKHIFTTDFLKQLRAPPLPPSGFAPWLNKFYGVNFNGNLGDFACATDALEIVQYLVSHDVAVKISTNGSSRNPNWWRRLAMPGVEIGFAIDGLEDTHSIYRIDTDWKKIIANARAFIDAGGHAIWRFIPFDHNRDQEDQCRKMSMDLGFKEFEKIYDGRDTGPVFSRQGEYVYYIGKNADPEGQVPAIADLLENHKTWYNAKTIKIQKDTSVLDIKCEHIQHEEIYLAADGSVYPCCFLGMYPGRMHHPGNDELQKIVKENNALEYSLEHCMSWFHKVQESWRRASLADGRLYQCVNVCNRAKID